MKGARSFLKTYLGRINTYATEKRVQVALPWVKGDVLDIGCGAACLAHSISKGQRYVGIDVNEEKVHLLKRKYINHPDYEFCCIDVDEDIASDLPSFNSAFDTISLLAVIEHLRNPESLLNYLHRLLKDEGRLLITTPTSVGEKIGSFISTTTLGMKDLHYPHVRVYNRASLTTIAEECGFPVLCYRGFEFGMNQLLVCSKSPGK